ncbi:borealin-2 [Archocentrus centrarchus]|uniref:borealin-2 n=1 Tax=Archocentrus centrarchus TaxID=63155 RepID=UPI0011EA3D44|nr:borealin-2-like [Archocentrus centrarchus]
MPLKRTRNARNVQSKEELSREMRHSKLTLFIQQFEKEAQERMNELEAKMDNMLATVEKVFKVELMKMPPALQITLIGDLISEEEVSASEVSIAMKSELREMPQPLRRMPSKRAKSPDSPDQSSPTQRPSSKTSKGVKGTKRTRTLVCSNSTGNLTPSVIAKRTQSRLASRKTNEPSVLNQSKPKLRSVVSAGDLHCSMAGSAAHITVTTAQGQMVSFSEETKDDINWDLLDDVAWCQIQKLSGLMDYLSRRSRCHR